MPRSQGRKFCPSLRVVNQIPEFSSKEIFKVKVTKGTSLTRADTPKKEQMHHGKEERGWVEYL